MVLTYLYGYISLDFFKGREGKESAEVGEDSRSCGLAVMVEHWKKSLLLKVENFVSQRKIFVCIHTQA